VTVPLALLLAEPRLRLTVRGFLALCLSLWAPAIGLTEYEGGTPQPGKPSLGLSLFITVTVCHCLSLSGAAAAAGSVRE
jgi:hypothetical protein